jgi:hypothetical protein
MDPLVPRLKIRGNGVLRLKARSRHPRISHRSLKSRGLRRTDVVRIFHNPVALQRFSACVLIEAHDEWQVSDRHYLSENSMALLTPPEPTALPTRPADRGVIETTQALTA